MKIRKIIPALLGLGIITVAYFFYSYMVHSKPKPKREIPKPHPTVVRIQVAKRADSVIWVKGAGTVLPSQQIELAPQVNGRTQFVSDQLIPGGLVRKGERLIEVEAIDYEYALQQAKANLANAELRLKEEKGREVIAGTEWELLGKDLAVDSAGRELALRQPQMRQAESARDAADSAVRQAELNLARTRLSSPFNAMVRRKNIDPGQLVTPQTSVATLVGTDSYWVRASIPLDQISFLRLPDRKGQGGATARVILSTQSQPVVKKGRVIRLLPDVEESGRMARLLIEVRDPLGLETGGPGEALLLGAFVAVEIEGKTLENVVTLPSVALREDNQLWIMNQRDQLEVRTVLPQWHQNDLILFAEGIEEGERVILSPLANALPGISLVADDTEVEKAAPPNAAVSTDQKELETGGESGQTQPQLNPESRPKSSSNELQKDKSTQAKTDAQPAQTKAKLNGASHAQ